MRNKNKTINFEQSQKEWNIKTNDYQTAHYAYGSQINNGQKTESETENEWKNVCVQSSLWALCGNYEIFKFIFLYSNDEKAR